MKVTSFLRTLVVFSKVQLSISYCIHAEISSLICFLQKDKKERMYKCNEERRGEERRGEEREEREEEREEREERRGGEERRGEEREKERRGEGRDLNRFELVAGHIQYM